MTLQITQLSNLMEGTLFRTSRTGKFYTLYGYDRMSGRMNTTASNGDYCQMRPKMKVIIHGEATY